MKRFYFWLCIISFLGCHLLLADLNDGLQAYFPFNGNPNDVTGNGFNGTGENITYTADRFGNANCALTFSDVEVAKIFPMQAEQTFAVWVNPATLNGYQPLLEKAIPGWGGEVDFQLRLPNDGNPNDGTINFCVNTDNGQTGIFASAISQTALPIGQWSFLACVIDQANDQVRLYVNGVLNGTASMGGRNVRNMNRPFRIGQQIGQQYSATFDGNIDDVRIYNRALSGAEIQSLYTGAYLGPIPTSPTLAPTNRTPTSAEIGIQTSGSFKVFTNGFVSGVALDPSKLTIVLTHGWNDSSDTWPSNMASQFVAAGISANLVAWDWRDAARSHETVPDSVKILMRTPAQGYALGTNLMLALGAGYNQPIHFIGHSFGTLVNAAAANYLHGDDPNNNPTQHLSPQRTEMTLLDEAELANLPNLPNELTIVSPVNVNLGWIKPLPNNFAWSDNYMSAAGEPQYFPNVVNVILMSELNENVPIVT